MSKFNPATDLYHCVHHSFLESELKEKLGQWGLAYVEAQEWASTIDELAEQKRMLAAIKKAFPGTGVDFSPFHVLADIKRIVARK